MARRQVNIVMNQTDPETGELAEEWVHDQDYDDTDIGVLLTWELGCSTFIPWSSILRVDWSTCACVECVPPKP